jgi:hypothetical protein
MWSAFDTEPVFVGKVGDEDALAALERCRKIETSPCQRDERDLLSAKKDWFVKRYSGSLISG